MLQRDRAPCQSQRTVKGALNQQASAGTQEGWAASYRTQRQGVPQDISNGLSPAVWTGPALVWLREKASLGRDLAALL